jgi:hypothetical protein
MHLKLLENKNKPILKISEKKLVKIRGEMNKMDTKIPRYFNLKKIVAGV